MPARIPQSVREGQLNSLPGKRFVRWQDGYKNKRSKAVMECQEGHEWAAMVDSLIHTESGCPKCAGLYNPSADEREAQIGKLPGVRFVGWEGAYKNIRSKVVVQCPKGHERSVCVGNLLNNGDGCPICSGNRRYAASEREQQLSAMPNMSFVRWLTAYRNNSSKAVMRCSNGHEWSASVSSLVNAAVGCPKCSNCYRPSADEREIQLNALPGVRFVRWDKEYKNNKSKVVMRCSKGHEWVGEVNSILSCGSGCPACARYGFDPSKAGALYALRSECGSFVKIGISNEPRRRISVLRRNTPFGFEPIHIHFSVDGHAVRDLEKAFHQNFESSGFSGFDGATEWLKFNPDILTIMRILGA